MNILFFYTPHQRLNLINQIQAEIIMSHRQKGDLIRVIRCQKELHHCQSNHNKSLFLCYDCMKSQNLFFEKIRAIGNVDIVNFNRKSYSIFYNVENIDELKGIKYKGTSIGYGVASTMISLFRDHNFDTTKVIKEINDEIKLSKQVLDNYIEQVDVFKPDLVYVFNGRFSMYAPIVEYSKLHNIQFKVFEFTSRKEKYHIINNTIPHDVDYEANDIEQTWLKNENLIEKYKIGRTFFENTSNGCSFLEDSFVAGQKHKLFSRFVNCNIISFFNSSIDEYASVPGWENFIYLYQNEVDAIRDICLEYLNDKSKQFILRIHPNLRGLNNTQILNLSTLKGLQNLLIIPPESSISSYDILKKSSKIITFGSTIGIEATYFGIPSISLGLGFHRDLDVTYIPKSKKDLYMLIEKNDLLPKPQENALKYGYWWLSFGVNFVNVKSTDFIFVPSKGECIISFIMKFFSLCLIKRLILFIVRGKFCMLKDGRYRKSLLREIFPWREK